MNDRPTASTVTDAELDELYERLAKAEQDADASIAAAAQLTTLVGKRSEKAAKAAEAQRQRADIAETELRVLRSGLRANGADPTQIQNLWAQIRLRNRQWREEKQRAEQVEELLRIANETSNRSEAERARAVQRAEQAEESTRRAMEQRQEMAEERYAWQERGDRAEAAAARVRRLVEGAANTTAACLSPYDIGRHELARQVLAELDKPSAPAAVAGLSLTEEQAAAVRAADAPPGTRVTRAVVEEVMQKTDPAEAETTTRVFAALHRSAEQDVSRVITLYEQWVKAGPPPLGTSVSRWWDARLVELHNAILPPDRCPQCGASNQCPLHAGQTEEQ